MTVRSRYSNLLAVVFVSFGVIAIVPTIRAQIDQPDLAGSNEQADGAERASTRNEDESPDETHASDSILAMILGSGATGVAFMSVLGLFSIVAVTVAVERAINMRRSRIMPVEFMEDLERLVERQAGPGSFVELCARTTAPVASVLHAGLLRQGRPLLEVEKSMEDAVAREMAELQAKIRPLSTVGSIAPLVGLLGTVVGMIIAFHTASQAGLGKAELLAKGIYMALLTTAGGLSVAIPALLLAAYFSGRIEKFIREMDLRLMAVMPCLAPIEPGRSFVERKEPQITAPAAEEARGLTEKKDEEPAAESWLGKPPAETTRMAASATEDRPTKSTVPESTPVEKKTKTDRSSFGPPGKRSSPNPLMSMDT